MTNSPRRSGARTRTRSLAALVTGLALATDGIDRLFSNDVAMLRWARGVGLGLVGRVPMLRRALVREAAGLSGDLPRLMR